MGRVLGIDLGTTFSAMAVINHGRPEIIANREGEHTTPSVVMFDGETPLVGIQARRSAVTAPESCVQFVKRHMGDPAYRFVGPDGTEYRAEQISALILKRLKEDAETFLGEPVTDAVISVPAYFDDPPRNATIDAATMAGLHVRRIINEPTAAALAYGLGDGPDGTVLVYDLGGGTFDVTIMGVVDHKLDTVRTDGNRNLGGFNWDNALMEELNRRFQEAGGSDLTAEPALLQDLRDRAEAAKHTLSSRDRAKVLLAAGGQTHSIAVTVDDFEALTKPLLDQTEMLVGAVLEDAGVRWGDINKVLLVGGSTRMRQVPAMLERLSGQRPSRELHPDEAVALGAAIGGAIDENEENRQKGKPAPNGALVDWTFDDVTAHALGIITLNADTLQDENSIVLAKGKKIPGKDNRTFYTLRDGQTALEVKVTQGESTDARDVRVIGEATMAIASHPARSPVEFSVGYDRDGVIHVSATDLIDHKQIGDLDIRRTANLTAGEVNKLTGDVKKLEVD